MSRVQLNWAGGSHNLGPTKFGSLATIRRGLCPLPAPLLSTASAMSLIAHSLIHSTAAAAISQVLSWAKQCFAHPVQLPRVSVTSAFYCSPVQHRDMATVMQLRSILDYMQAPLAKSDTKTNLVCFRCHGQMSREMFVHCNTAQIHIVSRLTADTLLNQLI